MADADALIDFDRRIHVAYVGGTAFEVWLTTHGDGELVRVPLSGDAFRLVVLDRCTVASEPLRLARDGREVVLLLKGSEFGRIGAERLRGLVLRAIKRANN